MENQLTTVRLYGALRAQFGKEFRLEVDTPGEAIRALCVLVKGFRAWILEHSEPGYQVIVGREARTLEGLDAPMGKELIQIVPVIEGAKNALTSVLVGAAMIAAVYFTGGMAGAGFSMVGTTGAYTAVIGMGVSLMVGGVVGMLSSPPDLDMQAGDKGPDDRPTNTFSGPHLTTGQGNPVPVGYGRLRIGGAIISLGISSETWPDKGFGGKAADNAGTPSGTGDLTPWVWAVGPV